MQITGLCNRVCMGWKMANLSLPYSPVGERFNIEVYGNRYFPPYYPSCGKNYIPYLCIRYVQGM